MSCLSFEGGARVTSRSSHLAFFRTTCATTPTPFIARGIASPHFELLRLDDPRSCSPLKTARLPQPRAHGSEKARLLQPRAHSSARGRRKKRAPRDDGALFH